MSVHTETRLEHKPRQWHLDPPLQIIPHRPPHPFFLLLSHIRRPIVPRPTPLLKPQIRLTSLGPSIQQQTMVVSRRLHPYKLPIVHKQINEQIYPSNQRRRPETCIVIW